MITTCVASEMMLKQAGCAFTRLSAPLITSRIPPTQMLVLAPHLLLKDVPREGLGLTAIGVGWPSDPYSTSHCQLSALCILSMYGEELPLATKITCPSHQINSAITPRRSPLPTSSAVGARHYL